MARIRERLDFQRIADLARANSVAVLARSCRTVAEGAHAPYSHMSIILDRMELARKLIRRGGTGSSRRLYGVRNQRERVIVGTLIHLDEENEKRRNVENRRPPMKLERTRRECLKCFRRFMADTRFLRLCPNCRIYASDNQGLDA